MRKPHKDDAWAPRALAILSAGLAALAIAPALAQADQDPERGLEDGDVAQAVAEQLYRDQGVDLTGLDVRVDEGIVYLEGDAESLAEKRRAARLAASVRGVLLVANELKVDPSPPRSDKAIRRDVILALLSDPATDSFEIDVEVNEGLVSLKGTVDSWAERRVAEEVVAHVDGVRSVDNDMDVLSIERSDDAIRDDIASRLRWDALIASQNIEVSVTQGRVELEGQVGSAVEKLEAMEDAWVAGVESVDASGLEVSESARDEQLMEEGSYISATATENALRSALAWDPRVDVGGVRVEVSDSRATLRGQVDTVRARRAAEQIAMDTSGVVFVRNRLEVEPGLEIDDSEVGQNVIGQLERDPFVDREEVLVEVDQGIVTLQGMVDSLFERAHADNAAARAEGVIRVRNRLEVDAGYSPLAYNPYTFDVDPNVYDWYSSVVYVGSKSDQELAEDVRDELWWSPYVDEDQVSVSVEGGVVTLRGDVDSWRERRAAASQAYEAGAVAVDNELALLR